MNRLKWEWKPIGAKMETKGYKVAKQTYLIIEKMTWLKYKRIRDIFSEKKISYQDINEVVNFIFEKLNKNGKTNTKKSEMKTN